MQVSTGDAAHRRADMPRWSTGADTVKLVFHSFGCHGPDPAPRVSRRRRELGLPARACVREAEVALAVASQTSDLARACVREAEGPRGRVANGAGSARACVRACAGANARGRVRPRAR